MAKKSPRLKKAQQLASANLQKQAKANKLQQAIAAPTQFVGKKVPVYKPNKYDVKAASLSNQFQRETEQDRQAAQNVSQNFQNRQFQGLSPMQRSHLQESANVALNRDLQNQDRALLGQQGTHGIRGGVALAQRQELARQGQEGRQKVQQNLNEMDIGQQQKNRAAAYEMESGEMAQRQLGREQAQDIVQGNRQAKKENKYAKKANQSLSRI
jgi:hypothetical protein